MEEEDSTFKKLGGWGNQFGDCSLLKEELGMRMIRMKSVL